MSEELLWWQQGRRSAVLDALLDLPLHDERVALDGVELRLQDDLLLVRPCPDERAATFEKEVEELLHGVLDDDGRKATGQENAAVLLDLSSYQAVQIAAHLERLVLKGVDFHVPPFRR
jgi:hypothetical protein